MTYEEGVQFILDKCKPLIPTKVEKSEKLEISDDLYIEYPGYKTYEAYGLPGDYAAYVTMSDSAAEGGKVIDTPTHIQLGKAIRYRVNDLNIISEFVDFIECLNEFGTSKIFQNTCSYETSFNASFQEKLYWVSMQEDLNYPKGLGRKHALSRYFEVAFCSDDMMKPRFDNHGMRPPPPFKYLLDNYKCPKFYDYWNGITDKSIPDLILL
jgi:hypothetical protein